MRAPHCGERKLSELDSARPERLAASGAFEQFTHGLDEAQIQGILFQPEPAGDYVT